MRTIIRKNAPTLDQRCHRCSGDERARSPSFVREMTEREGVAMGRQVSLLLMGLSVVVLTLAVSVSPASAASKAACKQQCQSGIAACESQAGKFAPGFAKAFRPTCKKTVLKACRKGDLSVCNNSASLLCSQPPPPSPTCGDGVREDGEECDAGDDVACPGACLVDCKCLTTQVYAIVDVMVEDFPYTVAKSSGYTGLQFGVCTEPYIEGVSGTQLEAVDVNTGIRGTTTGIWAKFAYVPSNWTGSVLVDIAVQHWVDWKVSCPDGWVPASGVKGGRLTTDTLGPCWRNGLCVHYAPLGDSDTFIADLSLSKADGSIVPFCQSGESFWPLQTQANAVDIHRACGDDRFVFLAHSNASPVRLLRR